MVSRKVQGQSSENGQVDGRDAVMDTVGVLVKINVTGAVEFVLDAPVPTNAGGNVGGRRGIANRRYAGLTGVPQKPGWWQNIYIYLIFTVFI